LIAKEVARLVSGDTRERFLDSDEEAKIGAPEEQQSGRPKTSRMYSCSRALSGASTC